MTLEDKSIPQTLVSLKIAKKHIDTPEMRERIVKEVVEMLTLYLAANVPQIGFPEITFGVDTALRKFKKSLGSNNLRK
jgi:hypothetical protein